MKTGNNINRASLRQPLSGYSWLLAGLLLISQMMMAQQQVPSHNEAASLTAEWEVSNTEMNKIARNGSNAEWINFRDDVTLDAATLFTDHAEAFGLNADDEMLGQQPNHDRLGFSHFKYQQYYKGLKVIGAEFIVHRNNEGHTYAANGKMVRNLQTDVQPQIGVNAALQLATDYLHEVSGKTVHLLSSPETQLVLVRPPNATSMAPDQFHLAWELKMLRKDPTLDRMVYIDAVTGEAVASHALSMVCSSGNGTTTWHGNRNINTDLFGGFNALHDDCETDADGTVYTLNYNFYGSTITEYLDVDNNWNSFTDQSGVSTHWAITRSKSYWALIHGLNSFNDNGADLFVYNNAKIGGSFYNACWCGGNILVGAGDSTLYDPTDDYGTPDIMGHEFTHAVTQYSAGLVYEKESGALNESFSDIFGEMVEQWIEGPGFEDWEMGEDRGNSLRDMSDPNAKNDPDTYRGVNWVSTACVPDGSNDFCGVHTNSSVQNYWFYLLSEGGSGVNDNVDAYDVTGIGSAAASRIAFRNLYVYLTSNSDYADAREGAIKAAEDLYGSCSNEALQTANAWYAVGVGTGLSNWDLDVACADFIPLFTSITRSGINTLTAGGDGCQVNIFPAAFEVTFKAANRVTLKPGFTAMAMSKFNAILDPCSFTGYKIPEMQSAEDDSAPEAISEIEQGLRGLDAYPNPFVDQTQLQYELSGGALGSIQVFDIFGQLIQLYEVEGSGVQQVHLPGAAAGTYLCRLVSENEVVATTQLVLIK